MEYDRYGQRGHGQFFSPERPYKKLKIYGGSRNVTMSQTPKTDRHLQRPATCRGYQWSQHTARSSFFAQKDAHLEFKKRLAPKQNQFHLQIKKQLDCKEDQLHLECKKQLDCKEEQLHLECKKQLDCKEEQLQELRRRVRQMNNCFKEELQKKDRELEEERRSSKKRQEELERKLEKAELSYKQVIESQQLQLEGERNRIRQLQLQLQNQESSFPNSVALLSQCKEEADRLGLCWELLNVFRSSLSGMWESLELHRKALQKTSDRVALPHRRELFKPVSTPRNAVAAFLFKGSSFLMLDNKDKGIFSPLDIQFRSSKGAINPEEGVDDGGLSEEFYTLFFEQVEDFTVKDIKFKGQKKKTEVKLFERMDKDSAIVLPCKFCDYEGQAYPLPPLVEKKYFCFGRMMLRALLHDKAIPSRLASSLMLDYCLGFDRRRAKKSYSQLRKELLELDPQYQWILARLDEAVLSLDSCITFGDILLSDDQTVINSPEKCTEFLSEFIYQQIIIPRTQQFDCIKSGFTSVENVNFTPFLEVCTYNEMKLLVSGYEELEPESILRCLQFERFTSSEMAIVDYFQETVKSMTRTQLCCLLRFATGMKALPAGAPFQITVTPLLVHTSKGDTSQTQGYPISHTCSKQIEIPIYASREELKEKLLEAIALENCVFSIK